MGDLLIYPEKGNASFGSGKQCWAFSIRTFAKMYASKFKTEVEKLMPKLWGENYYDPSSKKWKKESVGEDGK